MNIDQEFQRAMRHELRDIMPNVILPQDDGTYEVFGKYRIIPERHVSCYHSGMFQYHTHSSQLVYSRQILRLQFVQRYPVIRQQTDRIGQ